MSFELAFLEEALAEWQRLEGAIRAQMKNKLECGLSRCGNALRQVAA